MPTTRVACRSVVLRVVVGSAPPPASPPEPVCSTASNAPSVRASARYTRSPSSAAPCGDNPGADGLPPCSPPPGAAGSASTAPGPARIGPKARET